MEQTDRKNWLYQLQEADPEQIAKSGYEYAVIDPTFDGSDATRYTKKQIDAIAQNGTTVLAYLSIGEASAFNSFWKKEWGRQQDETLTVNKEAPDWLGRYPNPDWPESVKVRFWEEAWWDIVAQELDKIKRAGFSGVYLDIVDAFDYWGDKDTYQHESRLPADPASREEAAGRMMTFIRRIAHYAKEDNANFKVFPQNAEGIFEYDDGSYLRTIDGIGCEDLWYDEAEPSEEETREYRLSYLKQIAAAGKPVLSVDYVLTDTLNKEDEKRISTYFENCRKMGFFCFAAYMDRELDKFIPRKIVTSKPAKKKWLFF